MEEEKYKLFAFDPTEKYPAGSFSAYPNIPEGCDPTTVGIGDKCTISFKKNSRTKAELFSAKFLYEGDVDVCLALKDLLKQGKRTYDEVLAANGSEEEAAKALRDVVDLKKAGRSAGNKRKKSNGRGIAKRMRINREEEYNDDSMICPILEEAERRVKNVEKLMSDAEKEVEEMEEKRKIAEDDDRVAAEAAQTAWRNAGIALEHLRSIQVADVARKLSLIQLKKLKKDFKQFEKDIGEEVPEDEEDEDDDPRVVYVRQRSDSLVEKANNAETERNNKKKILEEAENDLTKAKNNLNIRKTKFKKIEKKFGDLRKKHRAMMNDLNEMENPVTEHEETSERIVQEKNHIGANKDGEDGNGADQSSFIDNKAAVGASLSSALDSSEQTKTVTPNDAVIPCHCDNAVEEASWDESNVDEHLPSTDA